MTEDTREKIREIALERDMSGENAPMYGKPPANKGVPASPETRAKLSESRTGEKNHMYGKHHSDETKAKLREKALIRAAKKKAERETAAENAENQDKTS